MKWPGSHIEPSITCDQLNDYKISTGSGDRLCNAPFTGLYITPEGLIRPCCAYSDQHAFGRIPQQSIKEALHSPNRKNLQHHLKKNNLDFGCQACLKNIRSGNYRGSISSLYTQYPPAKDPGIIDFELSHFCNLDCAMCYLHTASQAENKLFGEDFLRELTPYLKNVTATRFYGGEPFLIRIYQDIWQVLSRVNKDCQVHIQTNGTVFNPLVEQVLSGLNVFLGISIDAMNPTLYEKIRRGASFDLLMKNTARFNEIMQTQGKSLTLSFCPMPLNWREIPAVFAFADQMGSLLFFNTVNYPSRYSFDQRTSGELLRVVRELRAYQPDHSSNPHHTRNLESLQDLINGLERLAKAQEKTEIMFAPVALKAFLDGLRRQVQQENTISKFEEMLEGFDREYPVSPYLQAQIFQMDPAMIIRLIEDKYAQQDRQYFRNILLTDAEDPC